MAKIKTKKEIIRSQFMYIFLIPMLIYIGYDIIHRQVLRNTGLETTATITHVRGHRSGESDDPNIGIEYEIDGIVYRRNISVRAESRTYVGESVMIYYLASNHNIVNLASNDSRAIYSLLGRMGIWTVALVGVVISYISMTVSDIKKLKRAEAEIRIQKPTLTD